MSSTQTLRRALRIAACAFLAALLLALPVAARHAAADSTAAPAPAPAPALTADQTQQMLDVLQDPAKRAAFIATLQGMARALPAAKPQNAQAEVPAVPPTPSATPAPAAAPAAAAPLSLQPDSLGAQVISSVSDSAARLSDELVVTAKTVLDVPLLWGWLRFQATDSIARAQMLDLAWKLAVVLGVAVAALQATQRALIRPLAALSASAADRLAQADETEEPKGDDDSAADSGAESVLAAPEVSPARTTVALPSMLPMAPAGDPDGDASAVAPAPVAPSADGAPHLHRGHQSWTMLRRLPYLLAAAVLYLVPVAVFAFVGNLLVSAGLGNVGISRLVIHAILDSVMLGYAVLAAVRLLVAPEAPSLRLLQITSETALFVKFWARWLTIVALFGVTLVQIAAYLGMYSGARDALLKVVSLVLHIMMAIVVIQARSKVAARLRPPKTAHGPIARFRTWLARTWHIIALFYIVAIWVVLALEIQDGLSRLLRFAVVTSLITLAFRVVAIVMLGALERLFRPRANSLRPPEIQLRIRRYYRLSRVVTVAILVFLAGVMLLEAWGLNAIRRFQAGALGGQVVGATFSAGLTILIGLVVWESTTTAMQQHIARLDRDAQTARSARVRTLLPILRTSLLVTILVVVSLMVLSDIGVNIAPLLAGAGILGVAIGFGSQKLVQDLITGLFLLMENAMQVGDTVTAAGLSGTVETLSIRTMRLRAGDGSIHIVPFSSVTTVTNANRGLGNASVVVNVAYKEDTDRVADVLKDIASRMREEAAFKGAMLSELQLWGVDKVDGGMVSIAGQIVCTASGRWAVQREYNRRMKKQFEELGIEIYNPAKSITLEQLVLPVPASPEPEPEAVKQNGA